MDGIKRSDGYPLTPKAGDGMTLDLIDPLDPSVGRTGSVAQDTGTSSEPSTEPDSPAQSLEGTGVVNFILVSPPLTDPFDPSARITRSVPADSVPTEPEARSVPVDSAPAEPEARSVLADSVPTEPATGFILVDSAPTEPEARSVPADSVPTEPEARSVPADSAPAEPEHFLRISGLRKRFGRKEIVKGVDFSMNNGEIAGLLGPNGAGKTTIFYMIVGFHKPSAGSVFMDDVDITAMPMFRRARQGIAYLPQEASIFRKLKVEQNIWAILESRKDITHAEKKQRLESLIDEFGINRVRTQYGYTLSGGERRRTEIARSLATDPKFLLLDEPFAGIDPIAVFEIKQIIRKLSEKGIGVLITDHNVRDTLEITTKAFIINDGTIVARGDRDSILNNEMVRDIYLGSEFKM
jgi:lipopolysaccharide export system ATP-binding protein